MTLEDRCQEAFDKRVAGTAMLPASDLLSLMTKIEQLEQLEEIIAIKTSNFMENHAKHLICLKQLAEREATIAGLLAILTKINQLDYAGSLWMLDLRRITEEALSTTSPTEHLSQYVEAKIIERIGKPVCWIPEDAFDRLVGDEPKLLLSGVPCYKYDGEGTKPLFAIKGVE